MHDQMTMLHLGKCSIFLQHNILTTYFPISLFKVLRKFLFMGSPVVHLCRICGSTTDGDTFVDIFSAEGEKNHLEQKLNFCFTKEVSTKYYFFIGN